MSGASEIYFRDARLVPYLKIIQYNQYDPLY